MIGTVVESVSDQLFTSAVFGDVNGDGEQDLILTTDGGECLVYFGRQESVSVLTSNDADVVISGGDPSAGASGAATFGAMVSAGDVTGDGIADIVVGAPEMGEGKGGIYVIFGRSEWETSLSLDDGSSTVLLMGEAEGDSIGSDLLVADSDGDGVSAIYTIKGENAVYRISWTGESALDGGGESVSRLGPGGFGCSLNAQKSSGDPGWMILFVSFGLTWCIIARRKRILYVKKSGYRRIAGQGADHREISRFRFYGEGLHRSCQRPSSQKPGG